jgi:hypothetical protein
MNACYFNQFLQDYYFFYLSIKPINIKTTALWLMLNYLIDMKNLLSTTFQSSYFCFRTKRKQIKICMELLRIAFCQLYSFNYFFCRYIYGRIFRNLEKYTVLFLPH